MGTKCLSPHAHLVVGHKEETNLFPIELPRFFSTEKIKIIDDIFYYGQ